MKKKPALVKPTTLITFSIFVLISGILSMTAWFVMQALMATENATMEAANIDIKTERLDPALLDRVENIIKAKQSAPLPDRNSLRNPFVFKPVEIKPVTPPPATTEPVAPPATTKPPTEPVAPPPSS